MAYLSMENAGNLVAIISDIYVIDYTTIQNKIGTFEHITVTLRHAGGIIRVRCWTALWKCRQ